MSDEASIDDVQKRIQSAVAEMGGTEGLSPRSARQLVAMAEMSVFVESPTARPSPSLPQQDDEGGVFQGARTTRPESPCRYLPKQDDPDGAHSTESPSRHSTKHVKQADEDGVFQGARTTLLEPPSDRYLTKEVKDDEERAHSARLESPAAQSTKQAKQADEDRVFQGARTTLYLTKEVKDDEERAHSARLESPSGQNKKQAKDDEAPDVEPKGSTDHTVGSVSHIFICYGTIETWPTVGDLFSQDSVPAMVTAGVKSRMLPHPPAIGLFAPAERGSFSEGDVLVFPQMKLFRSVTCYSDVDNILDTVLGCNAGRDEKGETLKSSYAFICCHDATEFRQCSACGPILLSKMLCEIEAQNIAGLVQAFGSTHLEAWSSRGEVLLCLTDGRCCSYSNVNPAMVPLMVNYHFGDGGLTALPSDTFQAFWFALLGVLASGADLRASLSTLPELSLKSTSDPEKEASVRELIVGGHADGLFARMVALLLTSADCEEANSIDWRSIAAREINMAEKAIYGLARSARDMVASTADLSVSAPTESEMMIEAGLDHIHKLLATGKSLGQSVKVLLGGKAYPIGKKFLEPICGISRPEWREEFFGDKGARIGIVGGTRASC